MTEYKYPEATYRTTAVNETGVKGFSGIVGEQDFAISSPGSGEAGANPEQFLGLALATCLNATIEAIEKRNGYKHESKVKVDVYQAPDVYGLKFLVDVTVYIPETNISHAQAVAMYKLAESRCPVAKLIGHNDDVSFTLTDVWENK